MAVLVQ